MFSVSVSIITLFSLRLSSSFLLLHPHLPFTSIISSVFPTVTCCRRQFLSKKWPIQLPFLLSLFVGCVAHPWFFQMPRHFSHGRSNWSSSSFYRTVSRHFSHDRCNWSVRPSTELLSKVSKFQHRTQLGCSCSTLTVSSLNLNPFCWWKQSSFLMLLLLWQSGI
jgi:hypothetical protein